MIKISQTIKRTIENNPVAFATADNLSRPNVIGVAFVKVVGKDRILITDNYMDKNIKNIKQNKCVCLAVWDKKWSGYKLIGKASYYTKGKWKKIIENMPENKGLPAKGAVLINIFKIIKLH